MKLMFDDELQDICVSDNIMKCVENDEIINIFKALGCDEKYTNGKASDFERFDEWERILPLVVGHREEKKYFEKIAAFGLLPVEASNYSRQRSIDRWRQANSNMHIGVVEERREVTKKIPVSLSLSHTVPRCFFNIENNVLKNINKCDNFKALFGKIHELAIAEKNEEICLNIKCFDSEYVRPDPYLAEQIFKKKISGEKYNHSEQNKPRHLPGRIWQ